MAFDDQSVLDDKDQDNSPTPTEALANKVSSFFGLISKAGFTIVLVALFSWLILGPQRNLIPSNFWPILKWITLGLCLAYVLNRWLKQKGTLREHGAVTIKRKDLKSLGNVNRALVKENALLNQKLKYLNSKTIDGVSDDKVLGHCARIKNAKPEAKLTHKLYIPCSDSYSRLHNQGLKIISNVRFQDFIQVLPSHIAWCKERGFVLSSYLQQFSVAEAIDQLRFDILKAHWHETSFAHDQEIYGVSDFWEPAIYFWYLKQGDCETHAATVQALFLAAGLSDLLEMLTWNSCGKTYEGSEQGNGHSTIYAFSCVSESWHHLEPIRPQAADHYIDLPEIFDENDETNLRTFTLSFNSQMTRNAAPE